MLLKSILNTVKGWPLNELVEHYFKVTFRRYGAVPLTTQQREDHTLNRDAILAHLKWMCLEILEGRVVGDKAWQWLGHIQGELRGMEIFSYARIEAQNKV